MAGMGSEVSSFSGTERDDSMDLVDSALIDSRPYGGVGDMRPMLGSGIMMGSSSLKGYVDAPESRVVLLQCLLTASMITSGSSFGVASVDVGDVSEAQRSLTLSGDSEECVVLESNDNF